MDAVPPSTRYLNVVGKFNKGLYAASSQHFVSQKAAKDANLVVTPNTQASKVKHAQSKSLRWQRSAA